MNANFFKSINNGKIMKNVRKLRNIKLVTTEGEKII